METKEITDFLKIMGVRVALIKMEDGRSFTFENVHETSMSDDAKIDQHPVVKAVTQW